MRGGNWGLAAAIGLIIGGAAWAEEVLPATETTTEELTIQEAEDRAVDGFKKVALPSSMRKYVPLDPADLLKYAPGAAVNRNGSLAGIAQYRGMFSWRINNLVDGLPVSSACPNWMDPPLSFIPTGELRDVVVVRGVSPVSAGSETIGGTIRANARQGRFARSGEFEPHGIIGVGGQTVDSGYNGNALLWLSNDRHRFQVSGAYLQGGDFDSRSSKEIAPTGYERWRAAAGYGFRAGAQQMGVSYSFDKTGDTGTPALPMDLSTVDTHTFRADYGNAFGPVNVEARFHYIDGEHEMDNFSLRSPPRSISGTQMRRRSKSTARDYAYDLRGSMAVGGGELRFGTDVWLPENNADILNPDDPTFKIINFRGVKRRRFGFFGEWEDEPFDNWNLTAGARYTWVNSDAKRVGATGLGMNQLNADALVEAFNASNRNQHDHLFDLSMVTRLTLSDTMALEFGAARKQRAASYQERYLWLPLESTAGLADGRTYVGDVDLGPETAYHFDFGLNWATDRFYFTPRVFYKRVDDYIQGKPLTSGPAVAFRHTATNMVEGLGFCAANPASPTCVPLQFTNVDAEFYGFDAGFGVAITEDWRIDGTASYTRGRRRGAADDLYRIAPPNGILDLTYVGGNWSVTAEGEFFAEQNRVSETSGEQKTDGYVVLNLYGQYTFRGLLRIRAGVRNVFDSFHQSHVAGTNRVVADKEGDPVGLDVGERLPGPGRNFFIQADYHF